jgi:DNA-binding XRE family transcriptional regulator
MPSEGWTPAARARQAAKTAARWHAKVRANPDAHPLAKARVERDLSQRELGLLADVATATIASIEAGSGTSRFVRERLARALAAPESELGFA